MKTIIDNKTVVLIRKEAKHVWLVVMPDGQIQVQWTLNLVPFNLI
tara:strand:- start:101 stop:235 length:135 start_codon:yes stop_codon:yes gene_type:complete